MSVIIILIGALVGLGIIVGIATAISNHRSGGEETPVVHVSGDCTTCSGDDSDCEQVCQMKAATEPVEYFEDEELDRYRGRNADAYTDDEADEFVEVLETLRPEEVRPWSRSLILRGIEMPNQIKDEFIMLAEK